jgi:hypothetical protein
MTMLQLWRESIGRRLVAVRSRLVIATELDLDSSAADALLGENCACEAELELGQLEHVLYAVVSVIHAVRLARKRGLEMRPMSSVPTIPPRPIRDRVTPVT